MTMTKSLIVLAVLLSATTAFAQRYQVLVSEADEPMATGQLTPDWN